MYPPPGYGPPGPPSQPGPPGQGLPWPGYQQVPAGPKPPGSVTTARVILWIQGGFWGLSALGLLILAVTRLGQDDFAREGGDSATRTGYAVGTLLPMAFCAALAIFALTIAAKLRPGASGARICALLLEGVLIFFGVLGVLGGIIALVMHPVPWTIVLILMSLVWTAFPGTVFGCLLTRRAGEFLRA